MAMGYKAGWTPVKVRGKRHGIAAEKLHTRSRRAPELQKRPEPLVLASNPASRASTPRPRKRRRRDHEAKTPLESLPTEVLQQIFEYSANIDLPLVSRQMAHTLSKSHHLQNQLTTEILRPVLDHGTVDASPRDLSSAMRLLNSRFVTWNFFNSWLRTQRPLATTEIADPFESSGDEHIRNQWLALNPSRDLLPPRKLLSPPFTEDKTRFLAIFAPDVHDIINKNAAYGEVAQHGLIAAIEQGHGQAVRLLLSMGLSHSTELLRLAVESGCKEDIVTTLVTHTPSGDVTGALESLDLLDPVIWHWADKAREKGNVKGEWLVTFLRKMQRQKEAGRV